VFTAYCAHVAAKVAKNGKQTAAVDGREFVAGFTEPFTPVFSPASTKVLIPAIEDGWLVRRVVPVSDFKA